MERIAPAIPSSLVKSFGWDNFFLEVELHSKDEPRAYRYFPVDKARYDAFLAPGASAGKVLNAIKNLPGITCERVSNAEAA